MRIVVGFLFFLVSLSTVAENFKQAEFQRQHIKSMSVVAPVWEDYTNEDGTGLYWDIMKAIYEPVGISVKTKNVPWNRAMKMVSKYRTYNAIVGEYRDTEEQVIFPIYPIDVEYMSVLSKAGVKFEGPQSFKGKTVGWIKDYEVIPESQRNFELKEFRNIDQGIELLKSGAIDFLVEEWDEVAAAMQKNGMTTQDYNMNEMPEGTDVFVAFSIDNLSRELIEIYNERVVDLVESGEMAAIYKKWDLGEMPEMLLQITAEEE